MLSRELERCSLVRSNLSYPGVVVVGLYWRLEKENDGR
jgi:hypothetical protein